jgi:uncharacterized protein (DUF1800 family)
MFADAAKKLADPAWAWAAYKPDAERPWDLRMAGHLFRRAAFGADWSRLQEALSDGPERSVEKLVAPQADVAAFNRDEDAFEGSASADSLRAWWLRRMVITPHPLLEKMTLFWHDHFATSNAKVNSPALMQQHVQLLRKHALGQFEPLLQEVSRDPAMLVWLDANTNRKSRPNEKLARNLMERFSMGLGNYSDEDVREAARAFTGWAVLKNRLRYFDREHDSGAKKVLGREGNFDGEDVVRIVLEQEATPRLIVAKLYRWLISETEPPADRLINPLAASFAGHYDLSRLVKTILESNLFFSPLAYRRRIKSPVEFALGIVKGFDVVVPTSKMGNDLADLGQNLYYPPTVKGWQGGRRWINTATVIGRNRLAANLIGPTKDYGKKLDPAAVAQKHGHTNPEDAGRFMIDLLLQGDVEEKVAQSLLSAGGDGDDSQRIRDIAHAVAVSPEFQLA